VERLHFKLRLVSSTWVLPSTPVFLGNNSYPHTDNMFLSCVDVWHSPSSHLSPRAWRVWRGPRPRGPPLRPPGRRRRTGCCCATTRARPPRVQRSGWGQGESWAPARAPSRTPPPPDALRSCTWGRKEREAKRELETTHLLSFFLSSAALRVGLHAQCQTRNE